MNTENNKFYNVKVGTRTRAGNLNMLQSFVAQSNKSQSDVHTYYSNKYRGFDVSVEEIKEIVVDEIPETKVFDYLGRDEKDRKIEELSRKLENTKNAKQLTKFEGKIYVNKISPEFKSEIESLKNEYGKLKDRKDKLLKLVPSVINQKYYNTLNNISLRDFNVYNDYIEFVASIDGKLYSDDTEL